MLITAALNSASLHSDLFASVNVYSWVHTSIYIYIHVSGYVTRLRTPFWGFHELAHGLSSFSLEVNAAGLLGAACAFEIDAAGLLGTACALESDAVALPTLPDRGKY